MGRFRFSLQAALDAAIAREGEAARLAGRERAAVAQACSALRLLDERSRERAIIQRGLGRGALPASYWIATEFFCERLRGVRLESERAARGIEGRARVAAAAHGAARAARAALDRLREKRLAEHRRREDLREAADLDESNAMRGSALRDERSFRLKQT